MSVLHMLCVSSSVLGVGEILHALIPASLLRDRILFIRIPFELSCYYYSLRRWGGGSTGVIREPRHRPLLLVLYRTAKIWEFPPPSGLAGALTHAVSGDRDPQW